MSQGVSATTVLFPPVCKFTDKFDVSIALCRECLIQSLTVILAEIYIYLHTLEISERYCSCA